MTVAVGFIAEDDSIAFAASRPPMFRAHRSTRFSIRDSFLKPAARTISCAGRSLRAANQHCMKVSIAGSKIISADDGLPMMAGCSVRDALEESECRGEWRIIDREIATQRGCHQVIFGCTGCCRSFHPSPLLSERGARLKERVMLALILTDRRCEFGRTNHELNLSTSEREILKLLFIGNQVTINFNHSY